MDTKGYSSTKNKKGKWNEKFFQLNSEGIVSFDFKNNAVLDKSEKKYSFEEMEIFDQEPEPNIFSFKKENKELKYIKFDSVDVKKKFYSILEKNYHSFYLKKFFQKNYFDKKEILLGQINRKVEERFQFDTIKVLMKFLYDFHKTIYDMNNENLTKKRFIILVDELKFYIDNLIRIMTSVIDDYTTLKSIKSTRSSSVYVPGGKDKELVSSKKEEFLKNLFVCNEQSVSIFSEENTKRRLSENEMNKNTYKAIDSGSLPFTKKSSKTIKETSNKATSFLKNIVNNTKTNKSNKTVNEDTNKGTNHMRRSVKERNPPSLLNQVLDSSVSNDDINNFLIPTNSEINNISTSNNSLINEYNNDNNSNSINKTFDINSISIPNNIFKEKLYANIPARDHLNVKLELSYEFIGIITKYFSSRSDPENTIKGNISFYEPLTLLQRHCEKFFNSSFLKDAYNSKKDIPLQLSYITAFIIGEINLNYKRYLLPITPTQCETYEYVDLENKYSYIAEQVESGQYLEKNIAAYYCDSDYFTYYSDTTSKCFYNPITNALEYKELHPRRVYIKSQDKNSKGHLFYYFMPTLKIKNFVQGKKFFDFSGEIEIKCNSEDNVEGIFSLVEINNIEESKDPGVLHGYVYTENKKEVYYEFKGDWKHFLNFNDLTNSGNILWSIKESELYYKNKIGNFKNHRYYLPSQSLKLNNGFEELKGFIPNTDSRFREDIRNYENGNLKGSQKIFENIQDYNDKNLKPLYFCKGCDAIGKLYFYNGEYWKRREINKFVFEQKK